MSLSCFLFVKSAKLWISLLEDTVILKPNMFKQILKAAKIIGDMFRPMSVRTNGDLLTTQLTITLQNFFAWIGMTESIFKSGSIHFQTFPLLDQIT